MIASKAGWTSLRSADYCGVMLPYWVNWIKYLTSNYHSNLEKKGEIMLIFEDIQTPETGWSILKIPGARRAKVAGGWFVLITQG